MKAKLAKFTVDGYRNFGQPITIDFTDVHDYKFNTECVEDGIITKIGIYGPNGCGKSNLGFAIFNIVAHLTDKESSILKSNPGIFLNVDENTTKAYFSYTFKIGEDYFTFEYYKPAEESIAREILKKNEDVLYDYDYEAHEFLVKNFKDIAGENLNFAYLGENLSVLRYIANNSVQGEESPIASIMDFVSHMLWFRSVGGNAYIGLESGRVALEDWIINNGYIFDFSNFLRETCDIDIQLDTVKGIDGKPILVERHDNGFLVFNGVSSSGTSAIELFYFWMKSFDKVSFLYMDEFDAFYHFDLAFKTIGKLKNYPDMQAVFTTHNTSLLGNTVLRPDCYLIFHNHSLRSYIDMAGGREIREGHNLEKIYRNGGLNG